MRYDDWKCEVPPEEAEGSCAYCGEPTDNTYCNKECRIAYESDN